MVTQDRTYELERCLRRLLDLLDETWPPLCAAWGAKEHADYEARIAAWTANARALLPAEPVSLATADAGSIARALDRRS